MTHGVREQQIVPCSTHLVHQSQQPNIPFYTHRSLILAQPYISLMICHVLQLTQGSSRSLYCRRQLTDSNTGLRRRQPIRQGPLQTVNPQLTRRGILHSLSMQSGLIWEATGAWLLLGHEKEPPPKRE
jgi:hypothetical protein